MEQQQNNDEIDLIEVFNNFLKSIYYFANRWYKALAIITFTGFIIGFGMYMKDSNIYSNKMIGQTRFINKTIIIEMINSLNEVNKNNKGSIGKILSIPFNDIENLAEITADTIENMGSLITVKLLYRDTIDVEIFLNGLVNYINNNAYIKREIQISKRRNETLIEKIENEISKLDSLQKSILKNTAKSTVASPNSLLVMNEQITNFFHGDILKLESTKQDYMKNLEHLTAFDVISRFEQAKIKERSFIKTLAIFGSIAFGLGFFILLGFEIRRKAIQLIKK